jgi:peptidoglycan L-alanyl-D-glutamate endopeptidase CwlK
VTDRDKKRLDGVHPALVRAVAEIFREMEQWGTPMFVVEGVRTAARQAVLYAQGRGNVPGPIVTYKDGVIHRSNHQAHADGLGRAVDCAFVGGDPFAATHQWEAYGMAVERQGLKWGGRWSMYDLPHAELSTMAETPKKA